MSGQDAPTIRAGMRLGLSNWVSKLELFQYGWRATDSTGWLYRQPDFPDGLYEHTKDCPYEISELGNRLYLRPLRPWPLEVTTNDR